MAGVEVNDTAASLVVAGVVEELGKLVPLALLALVAPGRVRRLLVCDWLVLGLAAGAAFMAVEEVARRAVFLSGSLGPGGLFQEMMCLGRQSDWLECMGMTSFGLSPLSGDAVAALPYGGHAVVTGLVAVGVGVARHGWWRAGFVRGVLARGAGAGCGASRGAGGAGAGSVGGGG
ncbi:PrsW family glutamic-type intramembrane protease [Actinomyces howellii]|uniref:PrsW family glutamic-type intramembrane protease n=1 Tax=Actinomyces howellii TaxID=52771 RepID=UPI0018D52CF7|nr:PrsW family glutamic-type intramembrane protease [Actinomyces howellii]